jgi:murein DD-endopeptidase MepM/ murein hydrolase activator NlpD
LLVLPATPAFAEVTRAELDAARSEVNDISAELEDELAELEEAINQKWVFEDRISAIRDDIANREREIALAAFKARDQARSMYVSAGSAGTGVAVNPESIGVLGTKTAYLDAVVDLDVDAVNELFYLQEDRASLQSEIEVLLQQQEDLAAELDVRSNAILERLDEANERYQALYSQWQKEEAARRAAAEAARRRAAAAAAAAAAASSGYASSAYVDPSGRTCAVAGPHSFADTWGAPRSGGRTHTGLDMVAAMGTPLVAIENGTIWSPNWHWAGGNGLYLKGDSGDVYYYAHLQGYASGIVDGARVGVGQVIGYNGNSGNAAVPHLHLGYQPGGGRLTNPYQLMVKLCR